MLTSTLSYTEQGCIQKFCHGGGEANLGYEKKGVEAH